MPFYNKIYTNITNSMTLPFWDMWFWKAQNSFEFHGNFFTIWASIQTFFRYSYKPLRQLNFQQKKSIPGLIKYKLSDIT